MKVVYIPPDSMMTLKNNYIHYLDQNCDFSIKDRAYFLNTRIQEVLLNTSWSLHIPVLEKLIELNVNFNTTFIFLEDKEVSPLYHAIYSSNFYGYTFTKEQHQKHLEFIELLLKNGADVNWKDKYGQTILMIASVKSNNTNKALLDLLIKHGADLDNITDSEGYTGRDYLNAKPPEEYDPDWTPFEG